MPDHLHPAVSADADDAAGRVTQGKADGTADPRPHAAEPELDSRTHLGPFAVR